MTRRALPVLLAAGAVLTGCGLRDPYSQQPHTHHAAARVEPAELPLSEETPDRANGATRVLARYARAWVNWSAPTLAGERAALLALSTGRLAVQLRQDAAQAVKNRLREVSNAYSRGRYVGVIREAGGGAIVVTYEEVAPVGGSAQGAYHVYLARTGRTAHGWRVTQWQPATDS
jgi:hypothetical protein